MEKIDHAVSPGDGNGAPLSRQVTITLSAEQYERMFFQPEPPRHGDYAKRFANPTLLGLVGFMVPYSSTMLTLVQFAGADPPYTLVGLTGDYYFLGCIAMCLAGVAEFILGNTFPFAVFIIFGTHWGSLAYQQDVRTDTVAAFTKLGGADGAPYNSSQAFHNVTMAIVCFFLMIGTLRVNVVFVLLFFGLVMLFSFIAAADFAVPHATTAADVAHINTLLKFAGSFGLIGFFCGWYLILITVCDAVGLPCPLPVFDLSSKVFPHHEQQKKTVPEKN